MTKSFGGFVTANGRRLVFDNDIAWRAGFARFAGKEVDITIHERRATRSVQQNRFYHGVVVKILAEHLGYEPFEMHEALKCKFLSEEDVRTGLLRVRSTTELTTVEWEEIYIDPIRRFAAEKLGVVLPLPNEVPELEEP